VIAFDRQVESSCNLFFRGLALQTLLCRCDGGFDLLGVLALLAGRSI
jgi:hypothetical protein